MTTGQFLAAALRRWYLVVLGAVAALGLYHFTTSGPDVYTARVTLVVLTPHSDTNPNALQQPSPVAIASVAVMEANNAPNVVTASSPDATLVGKGVTSGESIELRHQGTQWSPSAPEPYIDIEAADFSPEAVATRIDDAVGRVRTAITEQEQHYNVAPAQRVILTQSPAAPAISSVPRSPTRALAVSALIGIGVTGWAVFRVDRALMRRKRRRERAGSLPDPSSASTRTIASEQVVVVPGPPAGRRGDG